MGKEEVAPDFIPDEAPDFIPDPQAGGSPAFAKPHADLMGPTDSKTAPVGEIEGAEASDRTLVNAATFGHGGELAAGIDTAVSKLGRAGRAARELMPEPLRGALTGPNVAELVDRHGDQSGALPLSGDASYRQRRNAYDALRAAGEEQHPVRTTAAEVAGAVTGAKAIGAALTALGAPAAGAAVAAPSTIPRAVAVGAGLGAGRAAGNAQELEDVPGALPGGAAVGAIGGLVGGTANKALGAAAVPPGSLKAAVKSAAKPAAAALTGQAVKPALTAAGVDKDTARVIGNTMSLLAIGAAGGGNKEVTKAAIGTIANFLRQRPDLVELVVQRIGEKGATMVAEQISSK